MLLTDVLASIRFRDDPRHIVRNRHDLELSTMAVGLSLEFLHHLHQPLVIARNRHAAPVEAWLPRTCRRGPVGAQVGLVECIRLAYNSRRRRNAL